MLICVFGSICLLNGENNSNSLNYFSKIILKRHNDNSLEVHEKWSIFQVTLLLGVGNGRCIQHQVFQRLSFFTNSKMPLSILVTVQTCPVTRDNVQSSEVHQKWSISKVFLFSGRANTAQYMFWGHFSANDKNSYKNCYNCYKLSIIMMWSSAIGSASKI
jgi:hypothetical protein